MTVDDGCILVILMPLLRSAAIGVGGIVTASPGNSKTPGWLLLAVVGGITKSPGSSNTSAFLLLAMADWTETQRMKKSA